MRVYTLLNKYECLFGGNLGTWHGKPYDIKLKPDAEPYRGKPFPVTRIHELTFKQELDRLEYLKVIKKVNLSQWGVPTFLIPKKCALCSSMELGKCDDVVRGTCSGYYDT